MSPRLRKALIVITSVVCVIYLIYRAFFTLNLSSPYAVFASLLLYVAEIYGVTVVLLYFLQVWDVSEPPEQPILEGRTVDVFVPTYNEDPDLLRVTLLACVRMDYPHRVYLCDDGGTDARCNDPDKGPGARARAAELKALCDELGVTYITRPKNVHAKAGNLNHAFEKTDGEFIIIFDADHVPEPNFITRLIGYFGDEKIAFVQTPHAFYNFRSFQSWFDPKNNVYWEDGQLFYSVIQPGRNRWGCPIFAGSAAMFRRKALAEVGYIATETITEDMHTGLRMQARGWRSLGIAQRLIVGQAAPDVTTFHSQRLRWGEGNLSIMAVDNPLTTRGLTLPQRLCYLGSMIHWAGGVFKLGIYFTPILMLLTGIPPVNQFSWGLFWLTVVYVFVSVFGARWVSFGYYSFWINEQFTMAGFWTQIQGTMRALFNRKGQQFVVTSKRGRQTKSLWPYLKPHVYFLAVSLIALIWGWSWVAFRISEDYFKPIMATGWTVFHMALALACIRRSLWPDDRHYAYRHTIQVPVSFVPEPEAGEPEREALGWGVTSDLNDTGVGIIVYENLPRNSMVRLKLYGMGERIETRAQVAWCKQVVSGSSAGIQRRGYRCGIRFVDLPRHQADLINLLCLHYAVPRLYQSYRGGKRFLLGRIYRWAKRHILGHREVKRETYWMPAVLGLPGEHPDVFYSVTEDIGHDTLSVMLDREVPVGSEMSLYLSTPLGPIEGVVRVFTNRKRNFAARTYYQCVLNLTHFEGQGRDLFHELLTPYEKKRSLPALKHERKALPVPMTKPTLRALAGAVPMFVLTILAFRLINADDFFLRDLVASEGTISPVAIKQMETIYENTLRQRHPSTDRLALLMKAMVRTDHMAQVDNLAQLLAPRAKNNLDLQIANANAYINSKNYEQALAQYEALLAQSRVRALPPEKQLQLETARARSQFHAGQVEEGVANFRNLINQYPDDLKLRYELAGYLTQKERYREAADVYENVDPDTQGLLLLASINAKLKQHQLALRQCDEVLTKDPDKSNRLEANLLKADIFQDMHNTAQAEAIYKSLSDSDPNNMTIRSRLAFMALSAKNYYQAMRLFHDLIREGSTSNDTILGFIDAASQVANATPDRITDSQRPVVLKLYESFRAGKMTDPKYLGRLAWVLNKLKEYDKSLNLLEAAIKQAPTDADLNNQYVGALVEAKQWDKALPLLERQLPTLARATPQQRRDVHQNLAMIYVAKNRLDEAEVQCQAVLKEDPNNVPAREQLAGIYGKQGKHKEALALLNEVARLAPNSPDLKVRMAQATLSAGDYATATDGFASLLNQNFDQPAIWTDFINAAAANKTVNEAQGSLLQRIANQAEGASNKSPLSVSVLSRLAWMLVQSGGENQKAMAVKLLNQAVATNPTNPDDLLELSGVLSSAGLHVEARDLYLRLPKDRQDSYRLVDIYSAVKAWNEAEAECFKILQRQPGDKRGRRLLADVYSWKPDYPASLKHFDELMKQYPEDDELAIREAEVRLWSRDFTVAFARFRKLYDRDPEDTRLWSNYLAAMAGLGTINEMSAEHATKMYSRSTMRDDVAAKLRGDVVFLARLATVLQRSGDRAHADRLLTQALALKPQDADVRKALARALAAANRLPDALKVVEGLKLEGEDRFLLVELHAAVRDWPTAEGLVRKMTDADPKDLTAKRWLADVLSWKRDYSVALDLFDELRKALPDDKEIPVRIAEVTLWKGDSDDALRRFRTLMTADSDSVRLWRGYLAALAGGKTIDDDDPDRVRTIQKRMEELDGPGGQELRNDPVFLARLAVALRRVGEPRKADDLLAQVDKMEPTDPTIRIELGGVLASAGRTAAALKLYEGLKLEGEDRFRIVEAYAAARDWPNAEKTIRDLLKANASDPAVRRWLADILSWNRDYDTSLSILRQLSEADPNNVGLRERVAEVTLWKRDFPAALGQYRKLIEASPARSSLWPGFLLAINNSRSLSQADADLVREIQKKVRTSTPTDLPLKTDPVFLARLASALRSAGNDDEAAPLFDEILALEPSDPAQKFELGMIFAAAGRAEAALKFYEGLKLDGENRFRLVEMYAAAELWAEAEKEAKRILDANPEDAQAKRWLADILSWKHEYVESLRLFAELQKALPKDREIPLRIAEVTLWSRDTAGALAQYRRLMADNPDRPEVWRGYLTAIADVSTFDRADTKWVRSILERAMSEAALDPSLQKDPVFVARLALALQRSGDREKAIELFAKATALPTVDEESRIALGGVLLAAGRTSEAEKLLLSVKLEGENRFRLVELYSSILAWDKAVASVQALLQVDPNDLQAKRWMADILSWKRDYAPSLVLFDELRQARPEDMDIAVRMAEVTLWSDDYPTALARFRALLVKTPDDVRLWPNYLAAVAGVSPLDKADASRAGLMYDRAVARDEVGAKLWNDVVFLARLAAVLQRAGDRTRPGQLLNQALALKPQEQTPDVRKSLARALAAANRLPDALRLIDGLKLEGQDRFLRIELYAAVRDWTRGEELAREMVEANPKDTEAKRWLADVLSWKRDYAGSLELFTQLIEDRPDDAEIPVRIAEVTLWKGDSDEALRRFRALMTANPNAPRLWRGYLAALAGTRTLDANDPDRVKLIRSSMDQGKEPGVQELRVDPVFLARLAVALRRVDEPAKANLLLAQVSAMQPNDPATRLELGGVLAAAGQTDAALKLYEGLKLEGQDRFRIVEAYAAARDWLNAEKAAREQLRATPTDPAAQLWLADVLSWKRDYTNSLAQLRKLSQAEPNNVSLRERIAEVTLWSGRHAEALALYRPLLSAAPGRFSLWPGFLFAVNSNTLIGKEDVALIREIQKRTGAATPADLPLKTDPIFLARLASALRAAGAEDEAGPLFDEVLALKPKDPTQRMELGMIFGSAGRADDALKFYEGLKLDGENRFRLVEMYAAAKRWNDAETQARRLAALDPNDRQAKRWLADILSWDGEHAEALRLFAELQRALPKDREIPVRIAEVTLWSGNYVSALEQFRKLYAESPDQPKVWRGYLAAIAGIEGFDKADLKSVRAIRDRALGPNPGEPGIGQDPVFLARLALAFQKGGDTADADRLFAQVNTLEPRADAARIELGGVLVIAGRLDAAEKLYKSVKLEGADRFRLVELYAAKRDWEKAEAAGRELYQLDPKDLQAKRWLADVLSWKREYVDSLELFAELQQARPNDLGIAVRVAEVTLWSEDYPVALALYRALLTRSPDKTDLWPDYLAAAAGAKPLDRADAARASRMYDRSLARDEIAAKLRANAVFLARLATVLQRAGDRTRADQLLTQAVALKPEDPDVRKSLARALASAGRVNDALKLVEGMKLEGRDRFLLVELHAAVSDWPGAQALAQTIVDNDPQDFDARRWLADILSWKRDYAAALELFANLAREKPDDLEIQVRIAEVTLWKGDIEDAARRFRDLVAADPIASRLWRGYLTALASVRTIDAADPERVRSIDLQVEEGASPEIQELRTEPVFLARLALALRRVDETTRANALLTKAVAIPVQEPATRLELAGVLTTAGRAEDALRLYEGMKLEGEDAFRLIEAYAAARDWTRAEKSIQDVLKLTPESVQGQRWLADVLSWNGDYDGSLTQFRQLAQVLPDDPTIPDRIAEVTLWARRYDAALDQYRKLLDVSPERSSLWPGFLLAVNNTKAPTQEDIDRVREIQKRVRAAAPADLPLKTDPVFLARLASTLYSIGETDQAAPLFAAALARQPKDVAQRMELGTIFAAAGRADDALALYQGLTFDGANRFRLIELYAAARDWKKAEAICRDLLKANSNDLEAKRWLADVLSWKNDHITSLTLFGELEKSLPQDREIPIRIAEVTLWSQDFPEALKRFRRLMASEPDQPRIWRGFLSSVAGVYRMDPADMRLVRAIRERILAPVPAEPGLMRDPVFLARLALALQNGGDKDDAERLFAQALAIEPRDDAGRIELGGILVAAAKFDEAEALYRTVELVGENRFRMVQLYAAKRDWEEAEDLCRGLLSANADDLEAKRWLADVLGWGGKHAVALTLLAQLAEALPKDRSIQIRQAEVTLWSRDYTTALGLYRKLLEEPNDQPLLWDGYLQALAGARYLSAKQDPALVRWINQRYQALSADVPAGDLRNDPVFLARLAVGMLRVGDVETSRTLFAKVIALDPKDPETRIRLGTIFVTGGRLDDALRFYADLPLEGPNRFRLIELYSSARDWIRAVALCRDILARNAADLEAKMWLANVLSWKRDHAEALTLFAELETALPEDEEIPVRIAEVTLWSREFAIALQKFRRLQNQDPDRPRIWRGMLAALTGVGRVTPEDARIVRDIHRKSLGPDTGDTDLKADALFLARMGVAMKRIGDQAESDRLLGLAYEKKPKETATRLELANVFAAAGKLEFALELTRGFPFQGEDRFRLVELYVTAQDWTEAEKQCRMILKRAPDDLEAKRWLADVLSWKRDHAEALDLFAELERVLPNDESIRVRQAETTLWSGDYHEALRRYHQLFKAGMDTQPRLWSGFLQAVVGAGSQTPADRAYVLKIHDRALADDAPDPELKINALFLARLGLALWEVGEPESSEKLFTLAWQFKTDSPEERIELGGVFAASGRFDQARELYKDLKLEGPNRFRVVELYSAAKDWIEAEKQVRAILAKNPSDIEAKRWLADVLSWKRDHAASLDLFAELEKLLPKDRFIPIREAEVTLWSGDYPGALRRYRKLIQDRPTDQPSLWTGYLQSLAGAGSRAPADRPVIQKIYDRALADDALDPALKTDPIFLARLALAMQIVDTEKSEKLFEQAWASRPTDTEALLDLAEVYGAAGKASDARTLSKDLKLDGADRYRRIQLAVAVKDWLEAEKISRAILEVTPDDLEAKRWLADILSWKRDHIQTLALFDELVRLQPKERFIEIRRAEATLWSGDAPTALVRYRALLTKPKEQSKLWDGYLKALIRTGTVLAVDTAFVQAIHEGTMAADSMGEELRSDAAFLARLARAHELVGIQNEAKLLFARAEALDPKEVLARLDWAVALYHSGRKDQSRKITKELKPEGENRFPLVELYAEAEEWDEAENQCRIILESRPEHRHARRWLADILAWKKNYSEALLIFRELEKDEPRNIDLKVRIAEITLASQDYAVALTLFEALPEDLFKSLAIQRSFLDAASSAVIDADPTAITLSRARWRDYLTAQRLERTVVPEVRPGSA